MRTRPNCIYEGGPGGSSPSLLTGVVRIASCGI